MRTSTWFKFEPPADWEESSEGARLVYRGPKGETLIVSSAAVTGAGEERGEQDAANRLLQNAFSSVRAALAHPDLSVTSTLKLDERVSGLACWTAEAETVDKQEIFIQSVFQNGIGVLMVTFEACNTPAAKANYQQFMKSVDANTPSPK
jgi:hypothetical protein